MDFNPQTFFPFGIQLGKRSESGGKSAFHPNWHWKHEVGSTRHLPGSFRPPHEVVGDRARWPQDSRDERRPARCCVPTGPCHPGEQAPGHQPSALRAWSPSCLVILTQPGPGPGGMTVSGPSRGASDSTHHPLTSARWISRAQEGGRRRPSARRTRLTPRVLLGCRLVLQPGRCILSLVESLWPRGARPAHLLSLEDSGHLVSPEVLGGFPEPAGSMKCRAHGAVLSLPSESRHFREGRWGTHFRVPPWFVQPVLLGGQAACLGDRIT